MFFFVATEPLVAYDVAVMDTVLLSLPFIRSILTYFSEKRYESKKGSMFTPLTAFMNEFKAMDYRYRHRDSMFLYQHNVNIIMIGPALKKMPC